MTAWHRLCTCCGPEGGQLKMASGVRGAAPTNAQHRPLKENSHMLVKNRKGFTLIELLIVVVIIGILAAIDRKSVV